MQDIGKGDYSVREEKIKQFHNRILDQYDFSKKDESCWEVAGWSSALAQRSRFDRLIRCSEFAGGSVLDWGCGAGDLYNYLVNFGKTFEYQGYDINSRMISVSERRFGNRFKTVPISFRVDECFDYIFASGLFQFTDNIDHEYYMDIIANMYDHARKAIAVNFLSALRDEENKDAHELYIAPEHIVQMLSAISRHWVIDHAYHPGNGDFTVALIRSESGREWKRPSFVNRSND